MRARNVTYPISVLALALTLWPFHTAMGQSGKEPFKIGGATITPVGFMDLTKTLRSTNTDTNIAFRVDARVTNLNLLGYYESDLMGGTGYTDFSPSSNSIQYFVRLYWIEARKGKIEMLAGQSWSMLTPNRQRISPLPSDIFNSESVDLNYMNGLTWDRTPGIRLVYHASSKVTAGISFENDGQVRPDIVSKLAFDPNLRVHLEIAGVESRTRLFNTAARQSFAKDGLGGSINGNVEVFKDFRVVSNSFWGNGEGRYLSGLAPDSIIRADGGSSLLHSGSAVSGLEYQKKNTQFYAYYGGIYIARNGQSRTIQETTAGVIQPLWTSARRGSIQVMAQYAYFMRDPWSATPGVSGNARESAVWFNVRYVFPSAAPAAAEDPHAGN